MKPTIQSRSTGPMRTPFIQFDVARSFDSESIA
jgi:hypothetical protein